MFSRSSEVEVKVGCCGFAGGMKRYFENFKAVEVQQTFYKPPRDQTLEQWRDKAPHNFEFAVKCWQVITHPSTSPTWRKAGLKLEREENYGLLRPTEENFEAWEKMLEICEILGSRVIVVQCPASFTATEENLANVREFFSSVERKVAIAFEPRGKSWTQEVVKDVCEELRFTHCVDLFAAMPQHLEGFAYTRLHGSPPGERMYRYKYTDQDLEELRLRVKGLRARSAYVMFNNVHMFEDAKRLLELLNDR